MIFAYIFIGIMIMVALFQLALIFGAPWGEYTLNGKYPGKLPMNIRLLAFVQILVALLFASLVVSKAGIALPGFYAIAKVGIWLVIGFFTVGIVVNMNSPSKKERQVMGPLNIIALICALFVALGENASDILR